MFDTANDSTPPGCTKILINLPVLWVDKLNQLAKSNFTSRAEILRRLVFEFLRDTNGNVPPAQWVVGEKKSQSRNQHATYEKTVEVASVPASEPYDGPLLA